MVLSSLKELKKLILLLIIFTNYSFGQINNSNQVEQIQSSTFQNNKAVSIRSNQSQQLAPVTYINEDDEYQGRQKEILNNLIVDSIPSDFPKYIKGKGVKWYNEEMDYYYRTHPDIVSETVRKKLLGY
jgi:hypothetical protein